MTPAVIAIKKAKISYQLHEYQHDPSSESYGEEAAMLLGLEEIRVFKTLLVAMEGDQKSLAVAVVPVARMLNLKAMASVLKVKKVAMANAAAAERSTGYVLGGISPIGQKKALPTVIDNTAIAFTTLFISGGRRGLEIEMSASDLAELTSATFSSISK